MTRRHSGPDFIESLARGLDVLTAFRPNERTLSLSTVAARTDLARPTARRILLTLEVLGYVRATATGYTLTPRVMTLGTTYVRSQGLWDIARPHMERLCDLTQESTSIAQLDGSDIVYVARVAVPKIVGVRVEIGSRLPALQTSLGKVLLAALSPDEVEAVLAQPSRSGITPRHQMEPVERDAMLRKVRAQDWALTDQELALGVRSVACPLRDGYGTVIGALNVNAHAAETSIEKLLNHHLPLLRETVSAVGKDFAYYDAAPQADRARRTIAHDPSSRPLSET